LRLRKNVMKEAANLITYAVRKEGYEISVLDAEMQPIYEYSAGNNPGSDAPSDSLDADDPRAIPVEKLEQMARRNAEELATEYGLPADKVVHDTDLEASWDDERKPAL